jgi:cobalt transport protein ATP-binding subunit
MPEMMLPSAPAAVDAIAVHDLSFRYPDGTHALKDVSFTIAPHEKIALVGPNGGGKSTLLLHLNGVLRSTSGEICINGTPLTDESIGQVRAIVGLVFQNPDDQLFSPRVRQDVAFGPLHMGMPESAIDERVTRALAAVGMEAYINRISHNLSVGEKKRIAIATVLSMDPQILVLDEPSAGLDPRARRDLIRLVSAFTGMTVLISTHDMRLAADLCTRTIVLDKGCVAAIGPTREVLYDRALMEQHGLETPDST